jgi:hypothetical protein
MERGPEARSLTVDEGHRSEVAVTFGRMLPTLGLRMSTFDDFHNDEFGGRSVPGSMKWEAIIS